MIALDKYTLAVWWIFTEINGFPGAEISYDFDDYVNSISYEAGELFNLINDPEAR